MVPSPSSPVTRHVFVSFVPSITPDTGRSQHNTLHQSLTCTQSSIYPVKMNQAKIQREREWRT